MIERVVPFTEGTETELRSKRLPTAGEILLVFAPLVLLAVAGNWLGLERYKGGCAGGQRPPAS